MAIGSVNSASASTNGGASASAGSMAMPTTWRWSTITEEGRMGKLRNIHPGEVLKEEFLDPLRVSAYRLAKETRIPQTRISFEQDNCWEVKRPL